MHFSRTSTLLKLLKSCSFGLNYTALAVSHFDLSFPHNLTYAHAASARLVAELPETKEDLKPKINYLLFLDKLNAKILFGCLEECSEIVSLYKRGGKAAVLA